MFVASADVADIIRKLRAEHAAELAAKDAEIARMAEENERLQRESDM